MQLAKLQQTIAAICAKGRNGPSYQGLGCPCLTLPGYLTSGVRYPRGKDAVNQLFIQKESTWSRLASWLPSGLEKPSFLRGGVLKLLGF